MKSLLKIMLFLGFVLVPLLALAAPGIPHQFYGTVSYTDGAAPSGLAVEAKINGSVVGSSVTANGNYGYNPNLLFALDNNGVNAGETVEFYVNGIKANETAIFVNGNSSQKNLTIPASLPTTPTSSPTPTGGGGGSVATATPSPNASPSPSPTTAPLSTAAKKADTNNDSKVDVLDFNSLMVNWGSSGGLADFTGDGTVDILDFNYLMIYWTA